VIERPRQEQIEQLVGGFRALLESYGPADPDDGVNPADAFFMYRLLLGRNPNATVDLPALLSYPRTLRELRQSVLDSDEFASGGTFTPPHRTWMTELDGFRFWFNTSDREMGVVMALGQYESNSVRFIKRACRAGMTCIDAGAQTGFFTCVMAAAVGATGTVHAFEPMPQSYELLLKNVQENGFGSRVRAYQRACSSAAKEIEASDVGTMYVAGTVPGCRQVSMTAVAVDETVHESVDLIKLDVEGHEPAALEGMRRLIARSHPVIVAECNEYLLERCSNMSGREYIALLNSYGYEVFDVNDLSAAVTPASPGPHLRIFDVVALPRQPIGDERRKAQAVTT
jgi:FkbM family methyltransferase